MDSPAVVVGGAAALTGATFAGLCLGASCATSNGAAAADTPKTTEQTQPLRFGVNGEWHVISVRDADLKGIGVNTTLIEYLRETCRLTGTKLGCGVGGCGVCTVMLSRRASPNGPLEHRHVNSCLLPLFSLHNTHVTTVEGIGSARDPHPVQTQVAELHGSQCGFCTPGMVMSLYTQLAQSDGAATATQLEKCLDGNLCRCTGYRPLLDAAKSFAKDFHNVLPGLPANKYTDADAAQRTVTVTTGLTKGQAPLDLPVVPELATKCLEMMNVPEKSLCNRLAFSDGVVHRPSSVPELLAFLSSAAAPRLFQGVFDGADLSSNIRNQDTWVDVSSIAELHSFWTAADGALHIGVQTSISTLMTRLGNAIAEADVVPSRSCNWVAMMAQLETFATPQARNGATVGNLLFTGDMLPVLSTIGATVVVSTSSSSQIVALSSLHRRADRPLGNAKGFATTLVLPACSQPEQDRTHYGAFKQGLGRALENLGLCSAGLAVSLTDAGIVSNADFVFGGVGWEPFRSTLSDSIVGKPWSLDTLKAELSTLMAEIPLDENSYGGRPEWRKTLFASFVFKFMAVSGASGVPDPSSVKLTLPRPITSAVQTFEVPDKGGITLTLDSQFCSGTGDIVQGKPDALGQSPGLIHYHSNGSHESFKFDETVSRAPVGCPERHMMAMEQTTGMAVFADDNPLGSGGLYAAYVSSKIARGRIKKVEATKALAMPGVYGYYDMRDFAAHAPTFKHMQAKEKGDLERFPQSITDAEEPTARAPLLATHWVNCVGDQIGIIVAETLPLARQAAETVEVEYEEEQPIFTIDEAIEANSFFSYNHGIENGNVDEAMQTAAHVVEGDLTMNGQEHWYTEPHGLTVIPGEDEEMTIITCTQCVMKTQLAVAKALGVPSCKVTCKVKRIGGAFGGKEVLSVHMAAVAAVAARALNRPVRMLLTRKQDMSISGQRHPFKFFYKAGFSAEGKMVALDATLYNNGGYSNSVTREVMDRALFHAINAYVIDNYRVRGRCCRTNLPDFTAYRGFGATQVMFMTETIMNEGAKKCGLSKEAIREMNLIPSGYKTPYGQIVPDSHFPRIWKEAFYKADVTKRRTEIDAFNKSNRWVKRGLSILPTMYGVNFPVNMLNQVGALVLVYTDGTVLVSHGGVEMGQGLNTKMAQIAAQAFGISTDKVHVGSTDSDKVPNNPPTAASYGADLNGMAVLNACQKINARLQPLRERYPEKLGGVRTPTLEAVSHSPSVVLVDQLLAEMAEGARPQCFLAANFRKLCEAAYYERIDLMAEGFYASPHGAEYQFAMETDDNSKRGDIWNYFAFGCGCAEVEVDCLTGVWRAVRCDVIMDVGSSLNAAIDIGQVEGAFIQGMGLCTTEELIWGDKFHPWLPQNGQLWNAGPSYKCPAPVDVPEDLRVHLLRQAKNEYAVHSSKAVGEPPTFLGGSVFFALYDAIESCRAERGVTEPFRLDVPATFERVRMACADDITEAAVSGEDSKQFRAKGSH